MKKSTFRIPIVIMVIVLLCTSVTSFSQVTKARERKEAKEARESMEYKSLGVLLGTRKIEFQTEIVQPSTGAKVYNVVQIDGSRFYVRCENPQNTSGGSSGARDNTTPNISPRTGLFFEGDIENWELNGSDKNKYYVIKFNALTRTGSPWGEIMMKAYVNKSADIEIRSHEGNMIYSNYSGYVQSY